MKIALDLSWRIELGEHRYVLEPLLFELLEAVERGGHLNFAAAAAGVSYRHAWGLMRTWEGRLGQPLLALQRGRGAQLTSTGRAMLDARAQAAQTAQATLAAAAASATALLAPTLLEPRSALRVVSSHGDEVPGFADALRARDWTVSLELAGSEAALRRYQRNEADVAGFHLPMGELGRTVGRALTSLLDDARDRVFLLELRTLGLMSRPQHPVRDLALLAGGGLRFINRQPGASTRLVLDGLLGLRGIAPGTIAGYRDEEYTHNAVAAMVASGRADCGFGTASAAAAFELAFEPFVQERFYLCVRRNAPRELSEAVASYAQSALARSGRAPSARELMPGVALLRRLHSPV